MGYTGPDSAVLVFGDVEKGLAPGTCDVLLIQRQGICALWAPTAACS